MGTFEEMKRAPSFLSVLIDTGLLLALLSVVSSVREGQVSIVATQTAMEQRMNRMEKEIPLPAPETITRVAQLESEVGNLKRDRAEMLEILRRLDDRTREIEKRIRE